MDEQNKIWTVSEINRLIKDILDQSFYPFRIRGEVCNLTIHRSGHVYFSLKDIRSQISAVYFRAASIARELNLANGMEVDIDGRLTVYEARGVCQILVNRITPLGTGELQKKFQLLQEKLRAEGLFDEPRKRPIPQFPETVGIVTSTQGAAIRDFCQIIQRRFADLHLRIYPAAVQGEAAAREIAAGIAFFNQTKTCDVIVVTRGGGSLEDLWAFNEEIVARAVAASEIPVISAVGHEVDYTICDFVADLRVPTPSAAAELVVQEKSRLRERVVQARNRTARAGQFQISQWRRLLERTVSALALRQPIRLIRDLQQKTDDAVMRIHNHTERKCAEASQKLQWLHGRMQALSPRQVLARGYSVILDQDGNIVKDAARIKINQDLHAVLARGQLEMEVKNINPKDHFQGALE